MAEREVQKVLKVVVIFSVREALFADFYKQSVYANKGNESEETKGKGEEHSSQHRH